MNLSSVHRGEVTCLRAGDRTDVFEDRTLLASERALGSGVPMTLAAISVGLAFHALLTRIGAVAWIAEVIATVFVFQLLAIESRAP